MLVRGASKDNFSLGIAKLIKCAGAHIDGHRGLGTKHGGRNINVLDVDEHLRTEPDSTIDSLVLLNSLNSKLAILHYQESMCLRTISLSAALA